MMRKYSVLMIMMLVSMVVIYTLTAQNAAARVQGGLHDLSISGISPFASGNTEEVCVFCHTPHHATKTQSYSTNPNTVGGAASISSFLWNRAIPVRAWTPYTSTTLQANTAGGPGTLSLLCLSCHDGIGAMNVLTRNPLTGAPDQPVAFNQFGDFAVSDPSIGRLNIGEGVCAGDNCASGGGNLQNDHPIGFSYDTVQPLDSGLQPVGSIPVAILNRLNLTANRSVECSTCHDPHLDNFGGTNFLVLSNNNSALCLGCHIK
ncbi:MAG: hypothetical protein C0402_11170 [Thermodesulfovibrio sp.]|nr:hypothetical protein [Thermodesulfovibrio sp.]